MRKKKELTPEQKHEKKRQKLSSDYYKVLEEYPVIADKDPDVRKSMKQDKRLLRQNMVIEKSVK